MDPVLVLRQLILDLLDGDSDLVDDGLHNSNDHQLPRLDVLLPGHESELHPDPEHLEET